MLVGHEIFWRDLRDQRALARDAGLTGSPMRAAASGARKGLPGLVTAGSVVA